MIAQLKCLYTNAHSMGNKEEEPETMVQSENYDLIAIPETQWDEQHNWNTTIEGYKFSRRDRLGRREGCCALD